MTTFAEIVQGQKDLPEWMTVPFTGFCLDSRKVQAGNIFIALKGINSDLAQSQAYIEQALSQQAIGVLTEIAAFADRAQVYYLPELRTKIGAWQQQFLQQQRPVMLARTLAVTGTNGKTTVSRLIAELLTSLGHATAVMGTTGNGILPHLQTSSHTTLDALQFQKLAYELSQQGAEFLALEASSHGLEQGRIAGTAIEVAAYTNLSRDHLDYHHTLEKYAAAKAMLFDVDTLQHAVIHQDDTFAHVMIEHAKQNPAKPKIWLYSAAECTSESRQITDHPCYYISDLKFSLQGATFQLHAPDQQHTMAESYAVRSPLLGQFNVENLLAAIISVEKMGFALIDILPHVEKLQGAAGRMQTLSDQDRLFIIDYAHTPDALQQVLHSLRHHVEGKLWAVFGCGGDRDRGKRPLMTQAAVDAADQVVLTSDNPRTEQLEQIFADMTEGTDMYSPDILQIQDRREAIKYAVRHAQTGDIVVIAGKGHENYQEIEGVRHWFDDVVEVRAAVAAQDCAVDTSYPAS